MNVPRRTPRTARTHVTVAPRKHSRAQTVAAWCIIVPLIAVAVSALVAVVVGLWRFIL